MSKVRVYSRGIFIGIEANDDNIHGLVEEQDCLSLKVNDDNFEITQEAYDLLFKTQMGDNHMGELECYMRDEDLIFAWDGPYLTLFNSNFIMGSNRLDFELLEKYITKIELPIQFIELCDSLDEN